MKRIEVCLTPELIHQFDLSGKIVVAVDIFRATSCMVSGMAYGVEAIYPVATVDECLELGKQGMVTAGERGGIKVDGFEIGNSPFDYMNDAYIGKSIAVSTTNGTKTIIASLAADEILIGAFLNINAIAEHLAHSGKDVVIHCAGWQGTVNLEDTLFAGALIAELAATHQIFGDPAFMAFQLFKTNKHDMLACAQQSSHAQRLAGFGVIKDIEFCLQRSLYSVLPVYKNGRLELID